MFQFLVLAGLVVAAAAGPPVVKSRADIEELKLALQKSREDDGLTLEQRMEANPLMNAWGNSGKLEGDIVLDDEQIEDMVEEYATGRMAYTRPNSRWPQATLVYEFGPGEYNLEQQRFIVTVMNILRDHTCVRFRVRTASDRAFVRMTGRNTGCYATVGFSANRVNVFNLARAAPGRGCFNWVVIAHELYHSLGFWHMQSTYNRYTYVRIHWENIQQGLAHAFYRWTQTTNLRAPYEYGSCMHYGTHFFSSNGRPTISTTRQYNGVLGQSVRVTGWDILRLARHYNCPGSWSAEAVEKARTTAYMQNEAGQIVEEKVDQPLAEELELLEGVDIIEE